MLSNLFSDLNEGIRHLQISIFGSFFELPIIRYQLDEDLYLRLLQNPSAPTCNLILLRGGVFHMSEDASYVKICCNELPNCRVFQMEKYTPMLNYEYAKELSKIIKYIRYHYADEPIYIMGFSMGGIFTLSYLAWGLDEADGYITVSAPNNFQHFNNVIKDHYFYRLHQQKIFKMYNKNNIEEVMEMFGIDQHFNNHFIINFTDNLKKYHLNYHSKFVSVVGTDDRLACTFGADCQHFEKPLSTLVIEGGTHCCKETVLYACAVVRSFYKQGVYSSKNIEDVAKNFNINSIFY